MRAGKRGRRQIRVAEPQDARREREEFAVELRVPVAHQGEQIAARRGARQPGLPRDVGERQPRLRLAERLDHGEALLEPGHHVALQYCCGIHARPLCDIRT